MKNVKKIALLLPVLLLSSCNFKFAYQIEGLSIEADEAADEEDDIDDKGSYDIKVWVDDKIVDLTRTQIQTFVSESMGKYNISAKVEPQSEGTAASSMLQDVQSGADLFIFAQDQLARLKVAGAITKLSDSVATYVKENNSEDSVKAASIDGGGEELYAFPVTSDNGYFLYYDRRVVSDDDAKDMSKILAKCESSGKKLNFEARSNGFYTVSYFLAAGLDCHSTWKLDEKTGKFYEHDDNFNSDGGLIAARGLTELNNSALVATNSLASKLGDSACAVISGIWEYDVAKKRLGDNLGCAELPYFTVNGQSYHLGSYDGYKLLGVKPQVDPKKASVCRKLARYLSSEICQTDRFNEVSWGPTNNNSSQKDGVLSHPGLAALRKQHEYATQQGQCPGAWFVALSTIVKDFDKKWTDDEFKKALKNYESGLDELLSED